MPLQDTFDQFTQVVSERLSDHKRRVLTGVTFRPAAVLIPLFEKNGEPHLLFTRRTNTVKHHKGQISFPGGAVDPEDAGPLEAALRETHEEVGVKPRDVAVLGKADDMLTVTNFLVTPYVGVIPHPYDYTINEHEIDEIIEIPLFHLLEKKDFEEGEREYKGKMYRIYYYHYGQYTVWGVTGQILHDFFEALDFGSKK